jgi:Undecaprenyl-phosphate galactose phosphotransferase WbaP
MLRFYVATDAMAVLVGFVMAWAMLVISTLPDIQQTGIFAFYDQNKFRTGSYFAVAVGCLMWFQHKGHYRVRMNFWQDLRNVVSTFSFGMMANCFLQVAVKNDLSRLWLVFAWVFAAFSAILFRGLFRRYLRRKGQWNVRTLLVGSGSTAEETMAALGSEISLGYVITAQIKNLPLEFMQAGRSWEKLCALYNVDYIVIALDGKEMDEAEKPIAQLMREAIPFSISPPRRNLPVLDMVPQYFFNSDVKLLTHSSGLEQPMPRFIKRMFDIVVSGTALLLASPLMLVLAVLVKRDGGPVFFGHKRIGKNGETFYCLKFRSMIANSQSILERYLAENPEAKAEWEATQKLKNDPRVTAFGNFLRSSSLDELPQLLNVLNGEMSLVGPRPIVKDEVSKYDYDIAHYYRVSPGITGLWQVSGRNDVSYAQRVKMDSWYVRNWSLWHDIAILCKTLPALLKRQGAY